MAEAQDIVRSKLLNKIVRVKITDGRIIVGKFECMDKLGNPFFQDCLEILDTQDPLYYEHDVFKS